jgi:capsular exopolysaccharide synthesis family protein
MSAEEQPRKSMSDEKEIRALVAPPSNGASGNGTSANGTPGNGTGNGVPERVMVYPSFAYGEEEPEEPTVPLSHYLWILKRRRWEILSFIAVSVVATAIVSARLAPVYESTATIDIDRQEPSSVVGQDANRTAALNDSDQFLATQLKLIQSDSVLRPVAQRFRIPAKDIENRSTDSATARAEEAPIVLKRLTVKRPPNTYLVLISYRSPDPHLAADVANGVAESFIENTYNIRFRATAGLSTFMEKQLEELKAKMERSSEALAGFEKELNVINPEEKTSILSSRLLQLNTEYTNAQAERVRKEAANDSVRGGSLDAALGSEQGDQLRRLSDRIAETRERFASVTSQYGSGHPEYKKAASQLSELERQFEALKASIGQRVASDFHQSQNRENMLKTALAETKAEFDQLNSRSFEYKALKQEAESNKGLYEELIRKIKEAGINSGFQNSSIRLADLARPALKPVFPDIKLNALLALLFSALIAVGSAIMGDVLDSTLKDPEDIQRTLKTDVLGSLPVVKPWRNHIAQIVANGHGTPAPDGASDAKDGKALVRRHAPISSYEEAVRTLRDSILLSDMARRPRSLLMTSATPREGKTTTVVHLAIAHSNQKRKTLLIDADLRRPGLHGRLGLKNEAGLRDVITDDADWHGLLQKMEDYPYLDTLVAGRSSQRAADQLGGVIQRIIHEADKEYDLILIDAPPLLGFAEALQMAAIVDGVVVVTLAGQTNRNAVRSVLTSLKRVKANVIGMALNEVRQDMSDRYYYYGYYGKYYSKYYKPTNA